MAINKDPVDVVIVGLGWTGSIMSIELAKAGLKVVALERGDDRTNVDFAYPKAADELRFGVRHKLMQRPKQSAVTVRQNIAQVALPTRVLGAFLPGDGVGGAGLHWTGQLMRPRPTDLTLGTFAREHYGKGQLPEDMRIQDFGVTYDELEPHFDFFEKVCGLSGQAGNVRGRIIDGGDPFEGARSNPYPLPPLEDSLSSSMFEKAARNLGYHPFPNPSAAVSRPWTNPYGMQLGPCNYCGFCSFYACVNFSKATPQTTILDAVKLLPNYEYRVNSNVIRVDLHDDKKTAKGVTYIDAAGQEVFQPARIVVLASFSLNNVRLMLLSGIGKPYDPVTDTGVVGRNYAWQMGSGMHLYFKNLEFNPFASAGTTGKMFNDFSPGTFDSTALGFIGGAKLHGSQPTGSPMKHPLPSGTPKWGEGWKASLKQNYGHHMALSMSLTNMSYRGVFLDLDPTYKDPYGQPLLRMTYDWQPNELKAAQFMGEKLKTIARELKPDVIDDTVIRPDAHFKTTAYVSTHNVGGAVMGTDPATSALNRYLQSWDVHNVFVPGGNAFPQNFQNNPTGTIGALTYWSAKAILEQYLQNPGPLVRV
ncbi:MAG: GMC family oxidoreductase [Janthinobacterium lividum]